MEDTIKIEKEKDVEFDAFSDGATVHRKYRLRTSKTRNTVTEPINYPTSAVGKKRMKSPNETSNDNKHDCPKCIKQFDSKTGLLNHLRMHDAVKKYSCALCQKPFDTNEELIEHKTVHEDEERIFVCKICKVAFSNHCDFMVHDITHVKKKMYKCVECTMYFKASYIKLHIQTHFNKSVKCDECGKSCASEIRLKTHMKTHDQKTFIECGECGRMCNDKKSYDYHMSSHTGIKPYQCLYCGVGFAANQQRKVHTQRVHLTDRPHQCTLCERKFKMAMDLKEHMNTHDRIKKFECDECGKKFINRTSFRAHKKVHTNEQMFDCPECDKKCPSRQALRTHLIYVHTSSKDFKCKLCNLLFKTIGALRRHNKSFKHKKKEDALEVKSNLDLK